MYHHSFVITKKEVKMKVDHFEKLSEEDLTNDILSAISKSKKLWRDLNELLMFEIQDPEFEWGRFDNEEGLIEWI